MIIEGQTNLQDFLNHVAQLPPDQQHEALLTEWSRLSCDKALIDSQIQASKANVWKNGTYSDPDWFARTVHASKRMGMVMQLLQQAIRSSKKLHHAKMTDKDNESKLTFERCFFKVAKLHLTGLQVKQLIDEAEKMMKEQP
jgi:hypothetical protein